METFSALLAICAGNSPVPDEFPAQRPVTRNFDVFFDLRPNKLLSKQSWGWWFQTPSRLLWRHRNVAFVDIRAVHTMEIQSICMLTLKIEIDPSHIENTHMTAVYPFHRLVEVADSMKIDLPIIPEYIKRHWMFLHITARWKRSTPFLISGSHHILRISYGINDE